MFAALDGMRVHLVGRTMSPVASDTGLVLTPTLDFAGTPAGIDVRKVVDTGIRPVINTGIAHKEPGVGQIGAGITHAPMGCFTQALAALASP